jgi:ABC-type transport system involved in cytochrome bd biosynthesis fused ATPase/permease subunit
MLPRYYLYYTFSSPLYVFAAFVIGYVLGLMGVSFKSGLIKLIILLAAIFILEATLRIACAKIRRDNLEKKARIRRRIARAENQHHWMGENQGW